MRNIGDIEYFNTTLEEYEVIYPNEISNYIVKMTFTVIKSFFCK